MKIIILALLLLAPSLFGCQSYDPAGAGHALAGVDWALTAAGGEGGAVVLSADQPPPSLRLDEGGDALRVTGFAGVNRYSGTCTIGDDNTITFSPLATTRMAGPEEHMQLESTFLAHLQGARSYVLERGKLSITTELGRLDFSAH